MIDANRLKSIPSEGRSVFLMANLAADRRRPAATRTGTACRTSPATPRSRWAAVRCASNNFLVDGFPVTDLQNRASTNPTMEACRT